MVQYDLMVQLVQLVRLDRLFHWVLLVQCGLLDHWVQFCRLVHLCQLSL